MNNEYKKAFRLVAPSDSSIERILNMTTKKRISFKPLIITAVIIAVLISCMLSVNAATDGKIVDAIKESPLFSNVTVFINGEEKVPNEIEMQIIDSMTVNGKKIYEDTENDYVVDIDEYEDGAYAVSITSN